MGFNSGMPEQEPTPETGDPQTSTDAQPATAFEWLGGEAAVRALVDRFYDLMDLEPAYAGIRALPAVGLPGKYETDDERPVHRVRITKPFFMGRTEVTVAVKHPAVPHPRLEFGHPRLRARHLPYAIGMAERDQWMQCMLQAMQEQGHPQALVERLLEAFYNTADWMRNKGG